MKNPAEKQDKTLPPGVAVDGSRIRAIREEKRLTQLYVSNVVGVTTDTISRWENNRYPNIKRENAEKLAAALEVDLAAILKGDDGPAAIESEPPPSREPNRGKLLFILLLLFVLTAGFTAYFLSRPQIPSVVRRLPRFGAPGEIIPVQIKVSRKEDEKGGFIIKELLPDGWRLVKSSPAAASGTVSSREAKWLVPAGTGPVNIYYTVRIRPDTPPDGNVAFKGSIVYRTDGITRNDAINGDHQIRIAGIHWADSNGDRKIDDDEIMPAYYLTEEMKGLGLDWQSVESIWNAGGYKWDSQRGGFVVLK